MELKLKENIVTVNETVYRSVKEADISADMNFPDYCTDIAKMLKCTVSPEIVSKTISGQRITVEINSKINLIYCDTKGNIRAYCISEAGTTTFEADSDIEGGQLLVKISGEKVNARPISPRKIDIHASFDVAVTVCKIQDIAIVCEALGAGCETREISIDAESHICSENKLIVLDETIDIGQSKPKICEILKYTVTPKLFEVKQISNKSVIKGEVLVKLLYSTEDENSDLEEFETSFQISQIIDLPGADENCSCLATLNLSSANLKAKADSSGENRQICAEIILEAQIECKKAQSFLMLDDAYSTECEMEIERKEHSFKILAENISHTELCKKNLELPTGDISEIKAMWCTPTVRSATFEDDNITVCGSIFVAIMGLDDSKTPFFCERTIDLEYKYKIENKKSNLSADITAACLNCGYILKGGNSVEVRAEIEISGNVFSEFKRNVITKMNLSPDSKIDKSRAFGLTVYFAKDGESVWDIAKRYSTSSKKIMEDNSLEGDILKKSGMLLISSK